MEGAEPDVRFLRHVAKDTTINSVALAVERAFLGTWTTRRVDSPSTPTSTTTTTGPTTINSPNPSRSRTNAEKKDDRLGELESILPRARATSVYVSRRADDGLFITDNLLGRRKKLSVVGYDTSMTMRCVEARRFLQFEIVEDAGAESSQARFLSAQPIVCRGVGIGAILVGSLAPLDALEQESLAALSDALAGVLDDIVLSESMMQLLAWREQDMSFCGPPLELQDVPCIPILTSLRRLADQVPGAALGEREEKANEWGQSKERSNEGSKDGIATSELPDQLIIRVFGLSWLYLSAVMAGKLFGDGMSVAPTLVAVLALVTGVGSLIALFPGIRSSMKMKGRKECEEMK
jgi:hypothetical protein